MSYQANAQKLETSSERLLELVAQITHAVETGRDSHESAAKVSTLGQQLALASSDFFEALTVVHCDNLSLSDVPNENSDDFADWARRVAHKRSYGPFPSLTTLSVDLRPMLAAE
jgi:hypothetical protein